MDYREVKNQLEETKLKLMKKAENPKLSLEEKENIQHSIINFEYIIELTDMNHYERGFDYDK
ncbi:DUF3896 family protein [Neobacillus kokaensis]|uniref:Membrane protein n=1 Tax=Neobacillus kokaensis TaxID=2759023 RepID=A0ABQ3N479_9BACI|nr:DUF3896 family protein [Neobacillus kokaensis]GHH98959.1 membrane protein [Neobacillus kokaensis]